MIQKIGSSKKKIFSFLAGITLLAASCGEPKARQMAYMTPAERDNYESYGILPDYIENNSDDTDALAFFLFVAGAIGIGFGATKVEDAIKKHREQRFQQIRNNNQR